MTNLWKALARRDMQQIHAHIAPYAGAAHAYEALAEIHSQIYALADHPGLGRAGRKPGTRFIIVMYHDVTYRATYRVRGQHVIIPRVRDTVTITDYGLCRCAVCSTVTLISRSTCRRQERRTFCRRSSRGMKAFST